MIPRFQIIPHDYKSIAVWGQRNVHRWLGRSQIQRAHLKNIVAGKGCDQ